MRVSINRGTPNHHPWIDGISPLFFPSSYWVPHLWNPPYSTIRGWWVHLAKSENQSTFSCRLVERFGDLWIPHVTKEPPGMGKNGKSTRTSWIPNVLFFFLWWCYNVLDSIAPTVGHIWTYESSARDFWGRRMGLQWRILKATTLRGRDAGTVLVHWKRHETTWKLTEWYDGRMISDMILYSCTPKSI